MAEYQGCYYLPVFQRIFGVTRQKVYMYFLSEDVKDIASVKGWLLNVNLNFISEFFFVLLNLDLYKYSVG